MSDIRVNAVDSIDIYSLRKVLASSQITDYEKVKFIRSNSKEIHSVLKTKLSPEEYTMLVQNRPLVSFKPIKNSLTKRGDKILLAQALGIETKDVDGAVSKASAAINGTQRLDGLSSDNIKSIRAYVYRHGTQKQLATFLDNELQTSKNISNTIKQNLEYHMGGMADYFIRPIHKMKNATFVELYNVIDKNIGQAQLNGKLSELEANKLSQWALLKLSILQDNSKLINAIKQHKNLTIE